MRQRINLAMVSVVAATILYGSFTRMSGTGAGPASFLLLHVAAYFGLAGALLVYFEDTGRGIMEAVLVASAFGLAVEVSQAFISYRTFSVIDAAANVAGASIVLLDHRLDSVTRIVEFEDRVIESALKL